MYYEELYDLYIVFLTSFSTFPSWKQKKRGYAEGKKIPCRKIELFATYKDKYRKDIVCKERVKS